MKESGIDSGARQIGRFFLAAIPAALGSAAVIWFTFYADVHDARHEISQEERAAAYTGATVRPKAKIAVEILPKDCTKITRADVDGETLILYAQNACGNLLDYVAWYWQEVSPNGTVLHQGYENTAFCPVPTQQGDIAECSTKIPTDDRTDKIRVWTQIHP